MKRDDAKTRRHIEDYGCTVIHVAEEDGLPPFSYSVGIAEQTGEPEVIVIGLKQEMALCRYPAFMPASTVQPSP